LSANVLAFLWWDNSQLNGSLFSIVGSTSKMIEERTDAVLIEQFQAVVERDAQGQQRHHRTHETSPAVGTDGIHALHQLKRIYEEK
jgi:hypothetical protein